MVDRSDPIAASAYSRSSSRDCSSRSSSRTKRGFEAPRVQNRSAYPRRSLGSRRAGMRSPLPKTGRGSAPPSSKASGPPTVDASGTPSAKEAGFRSTTSSSGTSAISASAATGGSTGKTATTSAGAGADAGDMSGGLKATAAPAASPGTMAASTEGVSLGSLPHGNSCRLGPPLEGILCGGQPTGVARCDTGCRSRHRLKGLPGSQTGRTLPPFAERKR
jgi:hypothetical protein